MRPLVEEVKAQALALAEKDRIIEDQTVSCVYCPTSKSVQKTKRLAPRKNVRQPNCALLKWKRWNKQVAAMEEEKLQLGN